MTTWLRTIRLLIARTVFILVLAQLAVAPAARAIPPRTWIEQYDNGILIFDPNDVARHHTRITLQNAVPVPYGSDPTVAFLALHGQPGGFVHTSVDEVVRHVRNNFPGFARAQHRVLLVCYGNVADQQGRTVASALADAFGDVYAANGAIHSPTLAARGTGAVHVYEGGRAVPTGEAWSLVRRSGQPPVHVSEAELLRLIDTGESPSVSQRLAGGSGGASARASIDLPGPTLSPEDIDSLHRAWRQNSAEATRARLDQLRAQMRSRSTGNGGGASGATDGYLSGGSQRSASTRAARLRGFARTTGSYAWSALEQAPRTLSRIGVGMGAGIIAGLPVELAVTELTGSRHLGFTAGYAAGTFAGIGAEMAIFGTSFAESASGAFSSVALWAAPAVIASHLMNVALDDLAAPIAAGDPQAIDLTLELTSWGGAGFFWYGGRAWWNDPGGTARSCFDYVTGH